MTFEIRAIDKKTSDLFVQTKHYSRRSSVFQYSYALIEDDKIEGVVVYGMPPLQIQKNAFREPFNFPIFELTRLVVQTTTKNAASFLIANSLRKLPKPCAVVSYADSAYNHCGIVYQSTNWHYTGSTISHDSMYLVDGKQVHPRTLASKGITSPKKWARENGIEEIPPKPKHRYFYFVGSQRQKKFMRGNLKYAIIENYPKCDYVRYDDGKRIELDINRMELV